MTTYLYIKTHKITGLKYLGKTTQDPHKYKGSGKYWKLHLNKHGNDHNTDILRECQTKEEVKQWGLYYSELYKVVESPEWANLRPENGDGGSAKGVIRSPEYRAKMSAAQKSRIISPEARNRKRIHSPETRAKMSAAAKKQITSPEKRAKLSAANKGRAPSPETRAKLAAVRKGRTHSPEARAKIGAAHKGRIISPETRAKMSAAAIARQAKFKSPS